MKKLFIVLAAMLMAGCGGPAGQVTAVFNGGGRDLLVASPVDETGTVTGPDYWGHVNLDVTVQTNCDVDLATVRLTRDATGIAAVLTADGMPTIVDHVRVAPNLWFNWTGLDWDLVALDQARGGRGQYITEREDGLDIRLSLRRGRQTRVQISIAAIVR